MYFRRPEGVNGELYGGIGTSTAGACSTTSSGAGVAGSRGKASQLRQITSEQAPNSTRPRRCARPVLSTRPGDRATSRTTCSVMSVGTRAARFGQANTARRPAPSLASRQLGLNSSRQRRTSRSVPAARRRAAPSSRRSRDSAEARLVEANPGDADHRERRNRLDAELRGSGRAEG